MNRSTLWGLDQFIATFAKVEGFRMTRSQAVDRLLALIPEPEKFAQGAKDEAE